jgi:pimeloyl-ACP methyl ester carboxylesterase
MQIEVSHHSTVLGGNSVHWVTAGNGPATLLLHGWPQTWYEWRHVIDAVSGDRLLIAPDLRGWGGTSGPDEGYDVAAVAEEVALLLDHLRIEAVDLVGHDWGVPVGYLLATTNRDRVRSFVAIEASIPGAGGEQLLDFSHGWNPLWFFPFLATPGLPVPLLAGKERVFFTWILTQMARNTPGAMTDDDLAVYLDAYGSAEAVRTSCGYYAQTWASAQQIRQASEEPLTIPVLAIGGEKSIGAQMQAYLQRLAPGAEGLVLSGCGHLVPEERPDELVQAITTFWSQAP